jgi:hypothetical protein
MAQEAIASLRIAGLLRRPDEAAYVSALEARVAAVRALCESYRDEGAVDVSTVLDALDAVPADEAETSRKSWPDPIRTRTTADMGSQMMAAPCRSCGRPFSPTHDGGAPGPTSRHPFMAVPAAETGSGEA